MAQSPKALKRHLQEYASLAYEEELRRALVPLADAFDAWRVGKVASSEIAERIHEFHQGPARELWKLYWLNRDPRIAVAHAIAVGALPREKVAPEALKFLAGLIENFKE
jgi:hypothetical protein